MASSEVVVFILQNKTGIISRVGTPQLSMAQAENKLWPLLLEEYKDVIELKGINNSAATASTNATISSLSDGQHYIFKVSERFWGLHRKSSEKFFFTTAKTTLITTYTFHVLDLSHASASNSDNSSDGALVRTIVKKQEQKKACDEKKFAEKSAAHLQAILKYYATNPGMEKQVRLDCDEHTQNSEIETEMTVGDVNILYSKALEIDNAIKGARPDIHNLIGVVLELGKKKPKDAVHFYRLAAEAGFHCAMLNLCIHEVFDANKWREKLIDAGYTKQLKEYDLI